MFTVLITGNSQSFLSKDKIVTPRGYYRGKGGDEEKVGQCIMSGSFRTILSLLKHPESYPLDHPWAMLRAVHAAADFEMEELPYSGSDAISRIYQGYTDGKIRTIVTDMTMVASGVRKEASARYGIEVLCCLHNPCAARMAERLDITCTQTGIRLAVEEHPDALCAFDNAPTVLMELAYLIHQGKAHLAGIITVPAGFVHICESKRMVKPFYGIPKLIIEGRRGSGNLAATLVNATLNYGDIEALRPGHDL